MSTLTRMVLAAGAVLLGVPTLVALPAARREPARRDGQVTVTPTCLPSPATSGVNRSITAGS